MSRGVVIETATGVIRRKITAPPTMLALQVAEGESLFAVVDDDGCVIDDEHVIVGETGDWVLVDGAPAGTVVPAGSPQYVPAP